MNPKIRFLLKTNNYGPSCYVIKKMKHYIIRNWVNPDVDVSEIVGICGTKEQGIILFNRLYEGGSQKGLVYITLDEFLVDESGYVLSSVNLRYAYVKFKSEFSDMSSIA